MATKKTPEYQFGSHLPVLIRCILLTDGPVLEMGMGMASSITTHWLCASTERELVSYENNPGFFRFAKEYERDRFHKIHCIKNWDEAQIERPWDVALIDHCPAERRIVDIKRLSNFAKFIVIHDTEGRRDIGYQYKTIWNLFKYQYNYELYLPKTTVVSNFVDLTDFGKDLDGYNKIYHRKV